MSKKLTKLKETNKLIKEIMIKLETYIFIENIDNINTDVNNNNN